MKKRIMNRVDEADVYLVDWAILLHISKDLLETNTPVILIDRSPPAYSGLFGRLQWFAWKKSWKLLLKGKIPSGCVVSEAHKRFVEEKIGIAPGKISVLNAGVDSKIFFREDKSFSDSLKFVYHGQLDKNRGVLALPIFIQHLINNNVKAELTLIGRGNVSSQLRDMSENYSWLTVHDLVPHSMIPSLLRKQDIGLLPMPERGIWPLASPLKRGEYLASGLLVFGINHTGHSFKFVDSQHYKLVEQEDFHDEGLRWAQSLTQETLANGAMESRNAAKRYLSWEDTVDVLEKVIHAALQNQ
jgi:glycosyltransferase involved in cell wall biosynthesis